MGGPLADVNLQKALAQLPETRLSPQPERSLPILPSIPEHQREYQEMQRDNGGPQYG